MLSDVEKSKIESAIVTIPKTGWGVLVFGEFILTAAHCIGWDSQVGMALGDWYVETVKTSIGQAIQTDSGDR
jgi:hypothetical protein